MAAGSERHVWTENEDKVAFYLYKFGGGVSSPDLVSWCSTLKIDPVSMKMRIGNFKALDGQGGLENWAIQSEKIYGLYKDVPKEEFRKSITAIVGN